MKRHRQRTRVKPNPNSKRPCHGTEVVDNELLALSSPVFLYLYEFINQDDRRVIPCLCRAFRDLIRTAPSFHTRDCKTFDKTAEALSWFNQAQPEKLHSIFAGEPTNEELESLLKLPIESLSVECASDEFKCHTLFLSDPHPQLTCLELIDASVLPDLNIGGNIKKLELTDTFITELSIERLPESLTSLEINCTSDDEFVVVGSKPLHKQCPDLRALTLWYEESPDIIQNTLTPLALNLVELDIVIEDHDSVDAKMFSSIRFEKLKRLRQKSRIPLPILPLQRLDRLELVGGIPGNELPLMGDNKQLHVHQFGLQDVLEPNGCIIDGLQFSRNLSVTELRCGFEAFIMPEFPRNVASAWISDAIHVQRLANGTVQTTGFPTLDSYHQICDMFTMVSCPLFGLTLRAANLKLLSKYKINPVRLCIRFKPVSFAPKPGVFKSVKEVRLDCPPEHELCRIPRIFPSVEHVRVMGVRYSEIAAFRQQFPQIQVHRGF